MGVEWSKIQPRERDKVDVCILYMAPDGSLHTSFVLFSRTTSVFFFRLWLYYFIKMQSAKHLKQYLANKFYIIVHMGIARKGPLHSWFFPKRLLSFCMDFINSFRLFLYFFLAYSLAISVLANVLNESCSFYLEDIPFWLAFSPRILLLFWKIWLQARHLLPNQ